jgi:hypothetical protein
LLADAVERTSGQEALGSWVYGQKKIGKTWSWILENPPEWRPDREQIATVEGIRKAVSRYAEKSGLSALPRGKPGRPRKTQLKS